MSSPLLSAARLVVLFLLTVTAIARAAPPGAADANSRKRHDAAPLIVIGPGSRVSGANVNDAQGGLLESVEQQRRLIAAQVRAQVADGLRAAKAGMEHHPLAAAKNLKLALEHVMRVPELSAETRAELRGQLETALREAGRRAVTKDALDTERAIERAAAEDRVRTSAALDRKQQRLTQLIDRFDSLVADGDHAAADTIGSSVVPQLAGDAPIAASTSLVAHQAGAHALNVALRSNRQKAMVGTLASVETSHVPSPDDEPMVYPAAEVWRERTRDRERFTNVDLRADGPAEARIRAALRQPTSVDFIETPLADAVTYLKDLHGIEIQVDTKALEDLRLSGDLPVTAEIENVSLRSALRLMLRPLDLTYVVKDEVLLITTPDVASQEVVTRVYPVEDLVVPIPTPGSGGIGGASSFGSFGPGNTGSYGPGGSGPGFNGPGANGPGFNNPGANGPGGLNNPGGNGRGFNFPGLNGPGNAPF